MTAPNVGCCRLSTRYWSCSSAGPSMESPTRNWLAARNSHHASSSSVPLVWMALKMVFPSASFFCNATALRKNSTPSSVGSPPCHAKLISGDWLAPDVLPDIFLQHRVAHAPLVFAGIQLFLFEIETVLAIKIADRPDGFRQDMKSVSGIGDGKRAHAAKNTALPAQRKFFQGAMRQGQEVGTPRRGVRASRRDAPAKRRIVVRPALLRWRFFHWRATFIMVKLSP